MPCKMHNTVLVTGDRGEAWERLVGVLWPVLPVLLPALEIPSGAIATTVRQNIKDTQPWHCFIT